MGIAAAVIGGASLLGGMASSKGSKQTTTSESAPWAAQQPYLLNAFQNAQSLYDSQNGSSWYQGGLYTPINDTQKSGVSYLTNWANGTGTNLANSAASSALSGMSNAGTFGANAANFASGNFNTTNGANDNTRNALDSYAQGALGTAGNFQDSLKTYMTGATGDPTQANISAAGQYMNNGVLQDQIDAAKADVLDTLGSNLVGLNNAASAGGNLNSSRAGAAEATMRSDAARTISDLSSSMRSQAYNQGLQLAEAARTSNLGAQATGLGTMSNYLNSGANAAGNALNFGEGQREFDISSMLQGNSQLGQSASLGYQGAQLAQSLGQGNGQSLLDAGSVIQDDANNQNQANYQSWLGNDQRGWDLLSRYMGIVGGQNWGRTDTSTTSQPGNFFQGALGGASLGAGILGKFCWVAREVYGEDNPKWMQFRAWLLTKAPRWFYNLYAKHGEQFAAYIADKTHLKSVVRFVFDTILKVQ